MDLVFNLETDRIMKKFFLALAALVISLAACNKADNTTPSRYSNVKVHLAVTAPDAQLTRANFSLTNPTNPIGGFNVTWKEGDCFHLILFQGDNANWRDNFIHQVLQLPAAAEGQTSFDLSTLITTVDLSGFDDTKNLKYAVVYEGTSHWNDSWKELNLWNGLPWMIAGLSPSEQISRGMFAETNVQEIAFPSGDLTLSGKLHWMTSVLAVQFDIDPVADIICPDESIFICELTKLSNDLIDCYFPILKQSDTYTSRLSFPINFGGSTPLSGALDANNCRYFVIPSDAILDAGGNARTLGGAEVSFRQSNPAVAFVSSGSLANVPIEPGKVYGIKVKVTDSDSDGVPEFAKL